MRGNDQWLAPPPGSWTLDDFWSGETLSLDEIGVSLAVDDLYEGSALQVQPAI